MRPVACLAALFAAALFAAASFVAALFMVSVSGCSPDKPQQLGKSCGGDYGPCAKGLRCSDKKKKCYLPVDCERLAVRIKACVPEIVELYAPSSKALPPRKRVDVMDKIRAHLTTDVVDHCRFDAAAFRKKHSTAPPQKKSYGEDPQAKELNACLGLQGCKPFARCFLGLARLVGPEAANPKDPKVFPVFPSRKAPMPDGGAPPDKPVPPEGMDAMEPATDAMKPAAEAMGSAPEAMGRPALPVMGRPAPMAMGRPALPTMGRPAPRPAPR